MKELPKHFHAPRRRDFQNLKLFARYLVGTKHYGHVSKLAVGIGLDDPLPLHAHTDSDWAGCEETRKSSSREAILLAGTVVETNSITQPGVPATSSGEAQLRALAPCGQSAVYVRNLAQNDFKLTRIWCDSSAALPAAKRVGIGKMRRVGATAYSNQAGHHR